MLNKKLVAGQQMEVPGFIVMSEFGYITHSGQTMEEHGYTVIMPHVLTFTVPDSFNPVAAEVAYLEKKLDKMADDYHTEAKRIKGRIQELLCLEFTPSGAA